MQMHVLLCSHNGEKYIAAQIQSIQQQHLAVDHIHIYDFSSTDRTLEIIQHLASQDTRLHVHSGIPALGAEASFNSAIRAISDQVAADDCIFLADQDDIWCPEKTQHVHTYFTQRIGQHPKILLAHDVQIVDAQLAPLASTFYSGDPYAIPRDLMPQRMLLCNPLIGHTMALSGALLQFIAQHVQAGKYLMHDWSISLLAARYGHIYFLQGQHLSLYRQHEKNIIGTHKRLSFCEKLKRTYTFSQKLIHQSQSFARDIIKIDALQPPVGCTFERLKKIVAQPQQDWRIYPYLISVSFKTGPTLKRKMLAVFFLVLWLRATTKI